MVQNDLIPADLSNRKIGAVQGYKNRDDIKKESINNLQSLQNETTSPESNIGCNLDEIAKRKITNYIPTPITEESMLAQHLAEMNRILDRNNDLLAEISGFLTTKSPTDSWFEAQTSSTVATPPNAVNPAQDPNNITNGIIPGYDEVEVNKRLQGRNAPKLWLVNDGLVPTGSNTGNDIFVITSTDGKSFSPEFRVAFGEVRIISDVYSFRFRCPAAGNFIRASEREIVPPYVSTIIVTGPGTTFATTANRPSFTAHQVNAPIGGISLTGGGAPSIPIPNGFAVVLKSDPDNVGTSRIYVANSIANTGVAANRFTLGPGDGVSLFITDANLIFIGSNNGTSNVDWIVEQ